MVKISSRAPSAPTSKIHISLAVTVILCTQTSIVGSNLEPAQKTTTSVSKNTLSSINAKGIRLQMIRRLVVLAERYVSSVEEVHVGNRLILPHAATFHGQPIRIKILYEPRKDEFSIEVRQT
jgi:hypothetical protein